MSYEALILGHNIMLETGQLGRLLWESSGSKNSKGEPGGLAADACHCADAVSVRRKRRSVNCDHALIDAILAPAGLGVEFPQPVI